MALDRVMDGYEITSKETGLSIDILNNKNTTFQVVFLILIFIKIYDIIKENEKE